MERDIHVKAGDRLPPIILAEDGGPIAIGGGASIYESIDGGPWHPADVINLSRGIVRAPSFTEGTHTVEYEIRWPDGQSEVVPSTGPQRIQAQPRIQAHPRRMAD